MTKELKKQVDLVNLNLKIIIAFTLLLIAGLLVYLVASFKFS